MKNILYLFLLIALLSCSKKNEDAPVDPEPVANVNLTKVQLDIIYPVLDAVLNEGRLYFVMPTYRQFIGMYGAGDTFGFQYYEHNVSFKARKDGEDLYVTIKGVEWKVRVEK